jgi:hypothetical protein
MPKRWRIVKGDSFTWQYIDTGAGPPKVVAKSNESWETKAEVRAEIEEMKRNDDIEDED